MLSLYLRRSLLRRPLRHFSLFWVLMCAFLLPLVVCIYRDSMIYGYQLQIMDFSKGSAIHISGVQPEDVELLRDIEGLTEPVYQDRWIYLNFASEEDWEYYSEIGNKASLNTRIKLRLTDAGRSADGVDIVFYEHDAVHGTQEDPVLLANMRNMQILSMALTLFSGLIVLSAYRSHIAAFSDELAELAALGAAKGQTFRMFLLELGLLFPFAAAGAVGISYAVMRVLYAQFFERTMDANLSWLVFHMDAQNTALLIVFYLLVCLAALCFAFLRKPRAIRVKKPGRKPASLETLWVQRTKPPFVQCLLILVPLVTVFVVLFNSYLGAYADFLREAQSVEISVFIGERGFTQEELDFISRQAGIRRVEPERELENFFMLVAPVGNIMPGRLYRYQDYAPGEPDLEKYQVMVNFSEEVESSEIYELRTGLTYKKAADVTLAGRIPSNDERGSFEFYISNALMDELTADAPVTRVRIFTTLPYASSLEAALREALPARCHFNNSGSMDMSASALFEGLLWTVGWIFFTLMLVTMQIVWVQLASYVRECAPMLRTVRQVGASRSQLARLIPTGRAAFCAAVLPFLIAVPYTWVSVWVRVGHIGEFLVSLPLVGIYAGIAVAAALTFWLPVKFALGKVK